MELVEEPLCSDVFGHFLRFLYSNEVQLQDDLVLPLLILADKYNIVALRAVCCHFAHDDLLPRYAAAVAAPLKSFILPRRYN